MCVCVCVMNKEANLVVETIFSQISKFSKPKCVSAQIV